MKESEFALSNYMFFVEDSVSFPKQFSDRKSVHGFGVGDAPKLTDENDFYRKSRKFMDFTNVLRAL